MSMNIFVEATREIIVKKTGKESKQSKFIEVWQTPTNVSYEIQMAENPLEAYYDWILTNSSDEKEPIYAPGDLFCEGDVIGYKIYNAGIEHVEKIRKEVSDLLEEVYEITVGIW